ncbi:hypothetical protein C5167_040845 [Papaver somniferum]|uniref:Uncharacterized protein n=1 Tax=Papaver somniferum TaxID=3469 RepID=A0A4Y7IJM6_PAPSO|nr:hypothetical protein C5167_040845 [Papaver somniferum]
MAGHRSSSMMTDPRLGVGALSFKSSMLESVFCQISRNDEERGVDGWYSQG